MKIKCAGCAKYTQVSFRRWLSHHFQKKERTVVWLHSQCFIDHLNALAQAGKEPPKEQ